MFVPKISYASETHYPALLGRPTVVVGRSYVLPLNFILCHPDSNIPPGQPISPRPKYISDRVPDMARNN